MFFTNDFKSKKQIDLYALIGVSSLAVIALWKYFKLTSKIIQTKQTIHLVKFRPFTKLEEVNKEKEGQTVLVQGAVDTTDRKSITKVINNRKTYLALNLKYTQPIYSNLSYDLKNQDYHLKLKQVLAGSCRLQVHQNFCLRSIDSNVNLPIVNLDRKDLSHALDLLQWQNKFRKLTFLEHFLVILSSLIGSLLKLLSIKISQNNFLKGFDIGHRQVEAGIQIGTSLTVLGTVGFTTEGVIFIQPSFVFKDTFLFLVELTQDLNQLSFKKNIWIGVLFGSLAYLGWRLYRYGKKNRYF